MSIDTVDESLEVPEQGVPVRTCLGTPCQSGSGTGTEEPAARTGRRTDRTGADGQGLQGPQDSQTGRETPQDIPVTREGCRQEHLLRQDQGRGEDVKEDLRVLLGSVRREVRDRTGSGPGQGALEPDQSPRLRSQDRQEVHQRRQEDRRQGQGQGTAARPTSPSSGTSSRSIWSPARTRTPDRRGRRTWTLPSTTRNHPA